MAAQNGGSVVMNWAAPAGQVDSYQILRRRRVDETMAVYIADSGSAVTTYTDTGITDASRHTYRVKAIQGCIIGRPAGHTLYRFDNADVLEKVWVLPSDNLFLADKTVYLE